MLCRLISCHRDLSCSHLVEDQGYDELPVFFADLDHPMPADGRITDIKVNAMLHADEANGWLERIFGDLHTGKIRPNEALIIDKCHL